jgi:phytoene dehydrogenase-like protein
MGSLSDERIVVVGGGHNGLVAATLLARAGRSVAVLERGAEVGGAAVSGTPFPGVGARLSRYAYLLSLFPAALLRSLGLAVELRARRIASYTPTADRGLLVDRDGVRTRPSMDVVTQDAGEYERWRRFYARTEHVARVVFPTLLEPLRSRAEMRGRIGDDEAWEALFEQPLSAVLEREFASDLVRGVVLTDATIGTFAAAGDPLLRQNRCFLYHVIGNGTGRWDVPAGGMGAVSSELAKAALAGGAEIRTGTEAVAIDTDGRRAVVRCADGSELECAHVLVNAAPVVLSRLLGDAGDEAPEGSQLKVNMLLARLPRPRDPDVDPADAFAGTFHVNEGYAQLEAAFHEADAGRIPSVVPCELYCHSLTDPTILDPGLQDAGAHTLTVFALHMPARLFSAGGTEAKARALTATLESINSVLAEPIEECLWRGPDGAPCLEAVTPVELEAQLGMPGGHIFHRDLAWPFAETEDEVGTWGVETAHPNVWLCGAGARRGGGVSGIPGHNAARAVLDSARTRSK